MNNIRLGDYNTLTVVKSVDFGLYLDGGKAGEILLPARYIPEGVEIGDELRVFIYLDQDERIIATTEEPLAKVGDFAYLSVNWVNQFGAFLDWGLMKDLFCPFREQKKEMEMGNSYIVHIHIDEETYRIVASAKVDRYINKEKCPYQPGDEVEILVWQKTDLGFKVIVENEYAGLVYEDQVFTHLQTGDRLRAYIKTVRPDGKIDIQLQRDGRQHTLDFAETLLDYLKENGGQCPVGDKSDPDAIYRLFHVSKKVFKKAVGDLYKRQLIEISPMSLKLK